MNIKEALDAVRSQHGRIEEIAKEMRPEFEEFIVALLDNPRLLETDGVVLDTDQCIMMMVFSVLGLGHLTISQAETQWLENWFRG